MPSRGYLCAAVLALGGLLLTGCGTAKPKATSTAPASRPDKAARPAAGSTKAAALEKAARSHAHYATGVIHEENGEMDLALEEYSKAALANLDDEELVSGVAGKFLARKQAERALTVLTNATARPNASGALFAQLGLVYLRLGKTDQATEANRTAIKKQPRRLEGYRNLFLTHLRAKHPEEAFRLLQQAAKVPDTGAEFLVGLAELGVTFALQTPEKKAAASAEAISALNRAAALKPDDTILRLRLADGFYELGVATNAVPIYLNVLKQSGGSDEFPVPRNAIRAKLVDIYLRSQDRAGAAEQLESIVREDPRNPAGYFYLGSIAFEAKDMTNAVTYFTKAIQLNPDFEQTYYDLASAQINLDQTLQALTTLERARAQFKENFIIPYLKGLTHSRRKDYAAAVASFKAAETFASVSEPKRLNELLYFQLGSAYERNGDLAQAERSFERAIELKPDFAAALNYLGYMWAERGTNLAKARELIERALRVEPKNAAYLDSLGWVFFKLGQPEAALEQLLKAVENAEEPDATIFDHLGDVHEALQQPEKARDAWSKSLKLEPSGQVQKKFDGLSGK